MDKRLNTVWWKRAFDGVGCNDGGCYGPLAHREDVLSVVSLAINMRVGDGNANRAAGTFLLSNGSYLHVRYYGTAAQWVAPGPSPRYGVRFAGLGGTSKAAEAACLANARDSRWSHLLLPKYNP